MSIFYKKVKALKDYLNQPYPLFINEWRPIIIASLFIAIFLLLFQPFGLFFFNSAYKSFIIIGYGGITFLILVLNMIIIPLIFPKVFREEKWKIYKEMIMAVLILFHIGTVNYFYTSFWFAFNYSYFKIFLLFQFYTVCVGIFPTVTIIIIKQNNLLKEYLRSSQEISNSLNSKDQHADRFLNEDIRIIADNEKDNFKIEPAALICIESVGNYIEICYIKEGRIKKHLLRNSLKRTELQLKDYDFIYKCHRAFLINLHKIIKVKGNSQGYRLKLHQMETDIPVSRNLTKSFKEKMESINMN